MKRFVKKYKPMQKQFQCKDCFLEFDERDIAIHHVISKHKKSHNFGQKPKLKAGQVFYPENVSDVIWRRPE